MPHLINRLKDTDARVRERTVDALGNIGGEGGLALKALIEAMRTDRLAKIRAGADLIIPQLGYDVRKFAEILKYMKHRNLNVPVLGNQIVPGGLFVFIVKYFIHGGHGGIISWLGIFSKSRKWGCVRAAIPPAHTPTPSLKRYMAGTRCKDGEALLPTTWGESSRTFQPQGVRGVSAPVETVR